MEVFFPLDPPLKLLGSWPVLTMYVTKLSQLVTKPTLCNTSYNSPPLIPIPIVSASAGSHFSSQLTITVASYIFSSVYTLHCCTVTSVTHSLHLQHCWFKKHWMIPLG